MKALLKGKILESKLVKDKTFTTIAQPAADEYQQPSQFKVMSVGTLGNIGDLVALQVNMSGYIKMRPYKDKNTGENKVYEDQILYLSAAPYTGAIK